MTADNPISGGATARRNFLKAAAAGAAITGTAGCLGSGGGSDTVRIGNLTSRSGPYATLGEFATTGAEMAVQELNQNDGIGGRDVELITKDTQTDQTTAIQRTRELIEDENVHLVTNVISSSVSLAASSECANLGVPFLSTINGTELLTGGDCNEYTFRTNSQAPQAAYACMKYLVEERDVNSIYIVGSDYAWGQAVQSFTEQALTELGLDPDEAIVGSELVPLDTSDYSTQITNATDSGADVCWSILAGTPAVQFLSQAGNFGLGEEMLISGPTINQVDHLRSLGDDAHGVVGGSRWSYSVDKPRSTDFTQAYLDEHGELPHVFAAEAYIGVHAFAEAVQTAESPDPESVIETWPGFTWDTIDNDGTVMRECDHQAMVPFYITEIVNENEYNGPYAGETDAGVYPQVVAEYGEEMFRDCEETGCNL
jgi:branched-chain amino acid transport system substrate-binding protein